MQKLKAAIIAAAILVMPDFNQPFSIECDASGKGIGTILSQNEKPIALFNKVSGKSSLSKSIYEKELTVLVLSIQH